MNQNEFITELQKIGILINEEQLKKLRIYYEMLIEENKKINLTSITEEKAVYLKHFYDSLTITKAVELSKENSLCDIGTGAGFPGIVLKIFYPNLHVTLIDSLNKRINFLNKVIKKLQLSEIEAIHSRIEDYSKVQEEKYDIVVSRAVASLNILLELGISLVKVDKYFISMKGNMETEPNFNNALIKLNCKQESILRFKLPFEDSTRNIIKIKKLNHISKKYPRKYSEIKKNPL